MIKIVQREENFFLVCNLKKESKEFMFKEVTEKEILDIREKFRLLDKSVKNIQGVIYKVNKSLFYTEVSKNISLKNLLSHKCIHCRRQHAKRFEEGGCNKVFDITCIALGYNRHKLVDSKRIEKYDQIQIGIETLCTTLKPQEILKVDKCKHFS